MRNAVLSLVLTLIGLTFFASAQAEIKCWTNSDEIRECGDMVPPEYVQQGHQSLGKDGIVRDKTKRAKTVKELIEEKRLAKLAAEEKKKREEQKRRDDILFETFTSVEDIVRVRDNHVLAIETKVKLALIRKRNIQAMLDKRIKMAADQERSGKTPSGTLIEEIESLKRQLKTNDSFIDKKRLEQDKVKKDHAVNIERYKKLTRAVN